MRRALVLFLFFPLLTGLAQAAGPHGGTVALLALAPDGDSLAWAATDRGLFGRSDGRWERVAALAQRPLRAVLDLGDTLLVLEEQRGVLRSGDGGATWKESNEGLKGRYGHAADDLRSLVQDPEDPEHLYLGAAGHGVFESRDGGRKWRLLLEGLEDEPAPAFYPTALLPPAEGRPLLMGTDGRGLYRWEDHGWTRAEGGGLPEGLRAQALAAAPDDPLHLGLATRGAGLWESRDGGKSWKLLRAGAFGVVGAVAVSRDGTVLAHFPEEGLVTARDGKAGRPALLDQAKMLCLVARRSGGWFAGLADDGVMEIGPQGALAGPRNEGLDATKILSLLPGAGDRQLWAGDANGVFWSGDGGATWEARDAGLLGAPAANLVSTAEGVVLGTGGQGVFLWRPETAAWEARSGGLGTSNTIFSLRADASGRRLYVGTEGGVYASDDGGLTWEPRHDGLSGGSVWLVAAHPAREGVVWAGGTDALFRSDDGGRSWTRLAAARPVALMPDRVGDGLWVLEEGRLGRLEGDEWKPVFAPPAGERFTCLAADGDMLWLGDSGGLWAVEGGSGRRVWSEAGVLSLLSAGDGRLTVGTDGRGVMRFRLP